MQPDSPQRTIPSVFPKSVHEMQVAHTQVGESSFPNMTEVGRWLETETQFDQNQFNVGQFRSPLLPAVVRLSEDH